MDSLWLRRIFEIICIMSFVYYVRIKISGPILFSSYAYSLSTFLAHS